MTDRKKFFLRKPVEIKIQQSIDMMSEMAKEYKEHKNIACAYQICSDQLQKTLTDIIRDDNHQIVSLKNTENMKMFGMVADQLLNLKNRKNEN